MSNWIELMDTLKEATEDELWAMLKKEKRPSFILRIHGRACRLRAERERKALFAALSK